MKRLLTILPILSIILIGCHKDPFADADIVPNPAYVGEDINFTNYSTNTEYSEWDMGDGTTSSAFNVIHFYYDPGQYNVTLKSFGKKSGVSTVSFAVDVIGSELKIIVKLWTPDGMEDQSYVLPNASVILYPTLQDWENETNPVSELFTNGVGECIFTNLSYQQYYVDVWEANHDNYTLASEDVIWIETRLLEVGYDHTFVAYVDYYENVKKSTSRSAQKELLMQEGSSGKKRELKINKISKPREK